MSDAGRRSEDRYFWRLTEVTRLAKRLQAEPPTLYSADEGSPIGG